MCGGEISRLGYEDGYIVNVRDNWGLSVLRPCLMPGRLPSSVRGKGGNKMHIVSYLMDNLAPLTLDGNGTRQNPVQLN